MEDLVGGLVPHDSPDVTLDAQRLNAPVPHMVQMLEVETGARSFRVFDELVVKGEESPST